MRRTPHPIFRLVRAFQSAFTESAKSCLVPIGWSSSALGGANRKIYERASYASLSFSPDGNSIAAAELDLSNNEAGIFTVNLQTGEKRGVWSTAGAWRSWSITPTKVYYTAFAGQIPLHIKFYDFDDPANAPSRHR